MTLEEASEKIVALKGNLMFLESTLIALVATLPPGQQDEFFAVLLAEVEAAKAQLLGAPVGELLIERFDHDAQRLFSRFRG